MSCHEEVNLFGLIMNFLGGYGSHGGGIVASLENKIIIYVLSTTLLYAQGGRNESFLGEYLLNQNYQFFAKKLSTSLKRGVTLLRFRPPCVCIQVLT